MNILILMIPLSLLLGATFIGAFVWAARQGQFDDLETPAHRILNQDNSIQKQQEKT